MSRSEALFFGGSILTMEDAPAPEAVLVRDGKIAAAGPLAALTALAPGARRRDLEGCCLMPAFLDAHSHITALASTLGLCQLGAAGSFREIRTALQDYRAAHPQGWTVGFGYDHNVLDERAHPTRQVLDECMPGVPVLITHASGHMGVASTAALEAMGARIEFDQATKTAIVTGEKASFTHVVGSDVITLADGSTVKMQCL